VRTVRALLDFCYIARRSALSEDDLSQLEDALSRFHQYREIFITAGVREDFLLPRQHAADHFASLIRLFGAPNGLCSSITESKHIRAVKEPWRRSNRNQALGQMLVTNQRLDQLIAARSDFTNRGMLNGPVRISQRLETLGKSLSAFIASVYLKATFCCSANLNFTATITTPEEAQLEETVDENPVNIVQQSVPDSDENPGDEIVHGLDVLAEVKLPSTVRKSAAQIHPQIHLNNCTERKWTLPLAARLLMQPQFPTLVRRFLYNQLYPNSTIPPRLILPESLPTIDGRIEVFNSAIATFRAPSDISGITGMRREHIRAMSSWRNGPARYDTVLINSNPDSDIVEGIYGFEIARILLFFAFRHQERHYPCALVHWFSSVGDEPDEDTGFWTVEPDFTDDGSPHLAIVHIDSMYRAVHLLAAHQDAQFISREFTMHSTLDEFKLFYVNKYVDHHAFDSLQHSG
jgi:hypothetical protein